MAKMKMVLSVRNSLACVEQPTVSRKSMTTISFNDDGELEQRFTPEHFQPVEIEAISEEQLEALKHTLVKPFTLIGQPLFRSRLFKTELGLYWFYDVHHMFFDGTSGKIMLNEICNLYLQETQPMSSGPDDYFLMLRERELLRKSAVYAQSRDYFERRYGGVNWSTRLECEQDTRNRKERLLHGRRALGDGGPERQAGCHGGLGL